MNKARIFLTFFCILILTQGLHAQDFGRFNERIQMDEEVAKMINQILLDKFDIILPQIMREREIDMWIHVVREGDLDPLGFNFGSNEGVFVFTDRGGDKIERAFFGWNTDKV
ncbi:MAG: hypothetical protein O7C75_09805, partial [Verrucomicrobia bacterium]|nr:hypothetical protein [Verrucomicrobiota bacterium]